MKVREFIRRVDEIGYGKRLPKAVYVYWEPESNLGLELNDLISGLIKRFEIGGGYNVLKFRTDEFKISFLAYPKFMTEAHPALRESLTVDLVSGKQRHIKYTGNPNPPILHRKELFIPSEHEKRELFARLSREEEEAGLYEETRTIGFRLNWQQLLDRKGFQISGHRLKKASADSVSAEKSDRVVPVERHKTAISRGDLSKPIKTLLEYGLLSKSETIFDYGCGLGSDIAGLRSLGYTANGWDPVYQPESPCTQSPIVNFGFVLNVIEDPAERIEALTKAFEIAGKLLVVAGLVKHTVDVSSAERLQDGVRTKINTFQKFFEQGELQQYIEDVLGYTAIPVAVGVFYVFRDQVAQQDFLQSRARRTIDWTAVNARLASVTRASMKTKQELFYQEHQRLLDAYWKKLIECGRRPLSTELGEWPALRHAIGTAGQVERFLFQRYGNSEYEDARRTRKEDLLVYVAKANLKKKVPFSHLSISIREDVKVFFGKYSIALEAGLELLYAAGDVDELQLACEEVDLGWQDEQALYVHRDLLDQLPPILRAYVGCAEVLFGDSSQADLIKLHKASGKVTFMVYNDFFGRPLPELEVRIKVNLRTGWTQVFDHRGQGQLLYYKERFISEQHPGRKKMERLSRRIFDFGIRLEAPSDGPGKRILLNFLDKRSIPRRSFGFSRLDE